MLTNLSPAANIAIAATISTIMAFALIFLFSKFNFFKKSFNEFCDAPVYQISSRRFKKNANLSFTNNTELPDETKKEKETNKDSIDFKPNFKNELIHSSFETHNKTCFKSSK